MVEVASVCKPAIRNTERRVYFQKKRKQRKKRRRDETAHSNGEEPSRALAVPPLTLCVRGCGEEEEHARRKDVFLHKDPLPPAAAVKDGKFESRGGERRGRGAKVGRGEPAPGVSAKGPEPLPRLRAALFAGSEGTRGVWTTNVVGRWA